MPYVFDAVPCILYIHAYATARIPPGYLKSSLRSAIRVVLLAKVPCKVLFYKGAIRLAGPRKDPLPIRVLWKVPGGSYPSPF